MGLAAQSDFLDVKGTNERMSLHFFLVEGEMTTDNKVVPGGVVVRARPGALPAGFCVRGSIQ